jgi:hypothetical protein
VPVLYIVDYFDPVAVSNKTKVRVAAVDSSLRATTSLLPSGLKAIDCATSYLILPIYGA